MADRPRAQRCGEVRRAGRVRLRADAVEPGGARHPRPRGQRAAAARDGQSRCGARLRGRRRHHPRHHGGRPADDSRRASAIGEGCYVPIPLLATLWHRASLAGAGDGRDECEGTGAPAVRSAGRPADCRLARFALCRGRPPVCSLSPTGGGRCWSWRARWPRPTCASTAS